MHGHGNSRILLTGNVMPDHNLYAGRRLRRDAPAVVGRSQVLQPGGALLAYGRLRALREAAQAAGPAGQH